MYFLGIDLGSSFVKVSLLDGDSGRAIASASAPGVEMEIAAPQPGQAEQDPERWWEEVRSAVRQILSASSVAPETIGAIGISYQMHGLVLVDRDQRVIRPAIIWCDSRAGAIGARAFRELGEANCLERFLNSPGNFTASKLKWVQEHEPELYDRIHKFMLPGDYIAMKLSGEIHTTVSGLSEGILWDFQAGTVAGSLLDYYGIDRELVPDLADTFSVQSLLSEAAAKELGLKAGTPIAYRSGDQPNNAFSLNVLHPGEMAATAGTSGVIYGVTNRPVYDVRSRVNPFVHVNHVTTDPRYGVLLCINGTGSLNGWLRKLLSLGGNVSYERMNELAATVPAGSGGLMVFPFGNGAERIFENRDTGATIRNFHFNIHTPAHLFRAAQEGIVYALNYGFEIMKSMNIHTGVIRAGRANMFLSPVFCETFASLTGALLELSNTDGAQGAARGAALGSGFYASTAEAFRGLEKVQTVEPDTILREKYNEMYANWLSVLGNV